MSSEALTHTAGASERKWRPLDRIQRRVAGVLVEKAKTTPDNYPLSLNSLVNGANQKSNRFPQMELNDDRVEQALDELRAMGAVALVQGDGRVDKHRHLLYDWLGVDKTELAVMAELLLRGAQTLGDLRGRAARMEPIPDIAALRPIVDQLRGKGLLLLLTPPGRGCVVTHNLYQPQELAKVRAEHGSFQDDGKSPESMPVVETSNRPAGGQRPVVASTSETHPSSRASADQLQALRDEMLQIKRELTQQREEVSQIVEQLRLEVEDLKQQLGV